MRKEEMYEDDEMEIDLLELAQVLLRKWYLILVSGVLCALLGLGITVFAITPQYESSAMIYILSKTTSLTSVMDLQIGKQLTVDFATLATSRPVVEKVIDKMELNTTYEDLVGTISVTNPSETQILKITVQNPDPQLACDLANAMAESTADRVAEVMVTDRPNTVEDAVVAEKPVSPSKKKNTAIAGLLGMIVVCAVLIIKCLMNDTIKTEEDVEKYLGVNLLASIPKSGASRGSRSGAKSRKA